MALSFVEAVDIDEGVFKYILIEITTKDDKKLIVRGFKRSPYHSDIFEEVEKSLPPNTKLKCLGGGRIENNPKDKIIKIYGYSQGYGKADHETTSKILKNYFNDYTITYTDEGLT